MIQQMFFASFAIGVGYTVISLILGSFLVGFDGFDSGTSTSVSPLRPVPIAAFLTVFGGVGILLYGGVWSAILVIVIAAAIGLASTYILVRFVLLPLAKAQNTSSISQKELLGETATVSEKIFESGFGKISYAVSGSITTSPAKSEGGGEILVGEKVEITNIENKIFYVKKININSEV